MKKLLLSASLILLGCNVTAEKTIEQAILDSDFNSVLNSAEVRFGLSESRRKQYLNIANGMIKSRENDTKSWIPYKGSFGLALNTFL